MTYVRILDKEGLIIYDSIPPSLSTIDFHNNNSKIFISVDKEKLQFRCGFTQNHKGKIFIITDERKYINSKGLFSDYLSINLLVIDSFIKIKLDISEKYNKQTQALIHNLRILNAQNIQNIFSLVPEQSLLKNIYEQQTIVEKTLQKNIQESAKSFLRVSKNNMSMKVEFSVFDKLMETSPQIKKEKHEIRRIILHILMNFSQDFKEKNIDLQMDSSSMEVDIDFETIFVCFFYIIQNAYKYSMPHSTLKIFLIEEDNTYKVYFNMLSLQILQKEVSKLCDDGFCGENAIKSGKSGSGIGMYRAHKTLTLNDATIEIKPRITELQKKSDGFVYEHNSIEIKFPIQKGWFN
jgi:hypothetical protein